MAQWLKIDTEIKIVIGPVVAVGDGFTPVTTLSLSAADEAEAIKHDASGVTDISSNTFAAITSADGYYNLTLTAGNVDTRGLLTVLINDDSLCLPVKQVFMVDAVNEIADAILKRDIDQVEATMPVHSLGTATLKSVGSVEDVGGTLRTYRTDGTTKHMDQIITTDTSNEPIDKLSVGT